MNSQVVDTLNHLYAEYTARTKSITLQCMAAEFGLEESYTIVDGEHRTISVTDPELRKELADLRLNTLFAEVNSMELDEPLIIERYKQSLTAFFDQLRSQRTYFAVETPMQGLVIAHVDDPVACYGCLGKGPFPLLSVPAYFPLNTAPGGSNSMVLEYGFWDSLKELDRLLHEMDELYMLSSTVLFRAIEMRYRYKTYQLLHRAFAALGPWLLRDLPVIFPFYVYGGEHDSELMNVYIFE